MTRADELKIKHATVEDVPLLLTFIRELANYEKLPDSVSATEERLRASLFGPNPTAYAILAYHNKKAVGYAIYFFTYSSFIALPGLYLEDLFVLPESRGEGVGRELLASLARLAIERGCARMEWAVLNWNEAAIGFYTRLGAEPMNEWTVYRLSGDKLNQLANKPATQ